MRVVERRVEVGGATFWTATQGKGPGLFLCHGGPGLWDTLHPVAEMLADRFTVHRYDQRGCGRSSGEQPWDGETFVQDLDGLRQAFGHDRIVAAGHSAGADLALAWSLRHPERCRALLYLTNCNSAIDPAWHGAYRENRLARMDPDDRERYRTLKEAGICRDECARLSLRADLAHPATALEVPGFTEFEVNLEINATLGYPWITPNAVAALDVPALVVHGMEDPRPWRCAVKLAETLPRGEFALLPGVGHFPWLEHPDRLAAALGEFVARHFLPDSH